MKGRLSVENGPIWFRVVQPDDQSLWVSGYVFVDGRAERTLNPTASCQFQDIYDGGVAANPPSGVLSLIRDLPHTSSWNGRTSPCKVTVEVSNVEIYDTPFETFHGKRDYGSLSRGQLVLLTAWYQPDGEDGIKWFRIRSDSRYFWVKSTEFQTGQRVFRAGLDCSSSEIYDSQYQLIPPES